VIDERLTRHLSSWVGVWPAPDRGLTVVGAESRTRPGWDGSIRPVRGVHTPDGTVLGVPPDRVAEIRRLGNSISEVGPRLAQALDLDGWRFNVGVFRWSNDPTIGIEPGRWVAPTAPGLPAWLRPFNGEVLIGCEDGAVTSGVGRKRHDDHGQELAVVTEEAFRGMGWAGLLVAQAARRVLAEGSIPTYLHGLSNEGSARTADRAGFPDRGWRVLSLFPP